MIRGGVLMIITFIGHRSLSAERDLAEKIRSAILANVPKNEKVSFYCGGYGDFDLLSAQVCRSLKSHFPQSELVYITPYMTPVQQKKMRYYLDEKLYDSVLYPPIETVPLRYAIRKRNDWMVREADLIFSYVIRPYGGAAKALEFAKKKKKNIVDLTQT